MPPATGTYTDATYADAEPVRIAAAPAHRTRRRRRARRRRSGLRVASWILLASVVLFILVVVIGMVLGAWRFAVIDTGSMRPTLNPGDVAVLTSEQRGDLRIGQIIAFHPPRQPHLTVMHRVVSLERKHNAVVFRTKGDANNAKDEWRAQVVGNTVWQEDLKVPAVGYVAVWSQQRPVRLGLLIVIIVLMVSLSLGWIWRSGNAG